MATGAPGARRPPKVVASPCPLHRPPGRSPSPIALTLHGGRIRGGAAYPPTRSGRGGPRKAWRRRPPPNLCPPHHLERRQSGTRVDAPPHDREPLALVEPARACVRFIDVEFDDARRTALCLVEKRRGQPRAALGRATQSWSRAPQRGSMATKPAGFSLASSPTTIMAPSARSARRRSASQARRASKSIGRPVSRQATTQRSMSAGRSASAKSRRPRFDALTAPSA